MSNNRIDFKGNPLEVIGFFDDVTSNFGDWVANGTPDPDSIPGVVQQRYRDICDSYSNAPDWLSAIGTPSRTAISNVCSPWLSANGSGDPVVNTPFSGGQCPGVEYEVKWTRVSYVEIECDDGSTSTVTVGSTGTLNTFGPISGPRRVVLAQGDCGDRTARMVLDGFESDGTPRSYVIFSVTVNGSFFAVGDINVTIDSVTRVDGQPDDCGDPGGEPGPNPNPRPDPGLDPEDEPFEREPNAPYIPMPPITDPYGDPVQLPNFPLPRIDGPSLFPEDEPPLAEPGEPGTPETVGGDEEAEGEADEDEVLTGVLVEVAIAPSFARTVQNVSTPTYIGACYVYLGWENQLDLQPEGQFLVDGQFFAAIPGMTHWRVRSAVGYTLTVTPFYASKE